MKRFWQAVAVEGGEVRLDGRPVRTPGRAPLVIPCPPLAEAIADEWRAVEGEIDPRAMPLTGLANAAIDLVEPDRLAFAAQLAKYGETDLLAYRAESPPGLIARQAAEWDPLLAWVQQRYDVHVEVAAGVMHRPQPAATVVRLRDATVALGAFELAALSPLVTIGGSLIAGLALVERAFDADQLWAVVNLDELWQEEMWGADPLAAAARDARRRDWDAAVRFLRLIR